MTHDRLVLAAARWLKRYRGSEPDRYEPGGYPVVLTELGTNCGQVPDAIGIGYCCSTLVECKVSRADFFRECDKPHARSGRDSVGNFRYYLCPEGVLRPEDIPETWGLLWLCGHSVRVIRLAPRTEGNPSAECILLISALRRVALQSVPGVSVRFYTIRTRRRATLGVRPAEAPCD